MKRAYTMLLMMLSLMLFASCAAGSVDQPAREADVSGDLVLLCTFYPAYITAVNVAMDVPGVSVRCMAPPQAGCLLDYQLTTSDRKAIEGADALIANGLNMEAFLPGIQAQSPDLPVIELCADIGYELLAWDGDHEDGHSHDGELNPHVWVSPAGAAAQASALGEALAVFDPAHAALYRQNAAAYSAELIALLDEMKRELEPAQGQGIATFHEAFPYLARDVGLTVEASLSREEGEQAAASDIASIVNAIREGRVRALFTEPDAPGNAAEAVSRETGLPLYTLDPLTRHNADGDAALYIRIQRENLNSLKNALLR